MDIQFVLNDQMVCMKSKGTETLLDFIRYTAQLKGTKIGCREGDCGACTVLVGSLHDGKLLYKSLTSCLTPLANIHGKHIVSVEGVNVPGLNKVQQAIVAHSGTQCGFCTPGFVMSLCGYVLNGEQQDLISAIGAMDGNICRCTGYKSLERAAQSVITALEEIDNTQRIENLIHHRFIPAYFTSIAAQLKDIRPLATENNGTVVAGGTDMYVKSHDEISEMPIHFLSNSTGAASFTVADKHCTLKGTTTVNDLMENKQLASAIPGWYHFLKLVSSTPIRNIATLGGNLVNASPIGDMTIILLALDSTLILTDIHQKHRTIPLHSFYKGYKILDKSSDELITEISFKVPDQDTKFNFEKVSKRSYLDIASVNTALMVHHEDREIKHLRCAIGGVGPIPMYLKATSDFLTGKIISAETICQASKILQTEISPISDARGKASYKRLLARQLFYSHFITLFPQYVKMEELL